MIGPVASNDAGDRKTNSRKKLANDGTVFGVFSGPRGHYVASEDDSGTHYQPPSGGGGWWSDERKKEELEEAIAAHNAEIGVGYDY